MYHPRCAQILMALALTMTVSETAGKCAYKPCSSGPHTMCIYPAFLDKSKPKCSGKESIAGLNNIMRRGILDRHNQLRQAVAEGKASGQPPAANMMKLSWNEELESIAQRFVNSCPDVGHDNCRNLKDGTRVGQNSGNNFMKVKEKKNKTEACVGVVESWYNEIKDMQPSFVDDVSTVGQMFGKIGHYSQLVWAETDRIGCGFLEYNPEEYFQFILLDCNYATAGNMMNKGTPIYIRGEPCSKCPSGTHCSKRYHGLCTAEKDEYHDVPNTRHKHHVRDAGTAGKASWSVVLAAASLRGLLEL